MVDALGLGFFIRPGPASPGPPRGRTSLGPPAAADKKEEPSRKGPLSSRCDSTSPWPPAAPTWPSCPRAAGPSPRLVVGVRDRERRRGEGLRLPRPSRDFRLSLRLVLCPWGSQMPRCGHDRSPGERPPRPGTRASHQQPLRAVPVSPVLTVSELPQTLLLGTPTCAREVP